MSIKEVTYYASGSVDIEGINVIMHDVVIAVGSVKDSIIRSLSIFNGDSFDSVAYIKRQDENGTIYQTIKVFIPPGQTSVIWNDFNILNEGHKLLLASDSDKVVVTIDCFEGVSS